MRTRIEDRPDEELEIVDSEAQVLFLELGIIDKFKRNTSDLPMMQAVIFNEHPTHHILALQYSGQPDPEENGPVALCFPKSRVALLTFLEMAKGFLGDGFPTAKQAEIFGGPRTQN